MALYCFNSRKNKGRIMKKYNTIHMKSISGKKIKKELMELVDMVASMSVDCKMGGITIGTYIANLKITANIMDKKYKGNVLQTKPTTEHICECGCKMECPACK